MLPAEEMPISQDLWQRLLQFGNLSGRCLWDLVSTIHGAQQRQNPIPSKVPDLLDSLLKIDTCRRGRQVGRGEPFQGESNAVAHRAPSDPRLDYGSAEPGQNLEEFGIRGG